MATEPERQSGPRYLGLRLPDRTIAGPSPTADRLRMVDQSSRAGKLPWIELRWNGRVVGYGPAEDDS